MFISFIYKDAETDKKVLSTIFFERVQFLMKYAEDATHGLTVITEITMKIEYVDDGRFSRPSENRYVKMSYTDFRNLMRVLGESQYGPFYTQLPLTYSKVVFASTAFAEESITIPGYVEPGMTTDAMTDLENRVLDLEDDLEFLTLPPSE